MSLIHVAYSLICISILFDISCSFFLIYFVISVIFFFYFIFYFFLVGFILFSLVMKFYFILSVS